MHSKFQLLKLFWIQAIEFGIQLLKTIQDCTIATIFRLFQMLLQVFRWYSFFEHQVFCGVYRFRYIISSCIYLYTVQVHVELYISCSCTGHVVSAQEPFQLNSLSVSAKSFRPRKNNEAGNSLNAVEKGQAVTVSVAVSTVSERKSSNELPSSTIVSCLKLTPHITGGLPMMERLLNWQNYISISFQLEWDMIVVTVFL